MALVRIRASGGQPAASTKLGEGQANHRAPQFLPDGRHFLFATGGTDSDEPHLHAPLNAVLRFGKTGERLVPVKLGARLTEVGTLEIWADSKETDHRWRQDC